MCFRHHGQWSANDLGHCGEAIGSAGGKVVGGGGGVGAWGPATHNGPKGSGTNSTTTGISSSGSDERRARELISGVIRLLVELRCVEAWKADAAAMYTVGDPEDNGVSEGLEEEEQLELSLRESLHMDYDVFRHKIDVALMRAITASHSVAIVHGDARLPSPPDYGSGSDNSSSRSCDGGGGHRAAVGGIFDRAHHRGWLDMEVDLEDWAFFLHGERNRQERERFISAAADKEEQQTAQTEAEVQTIGHQKGFLRGLFG